MGEWTVWTDDSGLGSEEARGIEAEFPVVVPERNVVMIIIIDGHIVFGSGHLIQL